MLRYAECYISISINNRYARAVSLIDATDEFIVPVMMWINIKIDSVKRFNYLVDDT